MCVCVCLTLLFVQQEVAVLVSTSDGVRDTVSIRVVSINDGDQRIWTSIFTQEGLIPDRRSETDGQKQKQTDRQLKTARKWEEKE